MKICVKCKLRKPTEEFSKNNKNGDRLYSYCKPCAALKTQERRNQFIFSGIFSVTKVCSHCRVEKLAKEFAKNRSHKTGLQDWCRACISIGLAKWWAKRSAEEKELSNCKVRLFLLKKKYGLTPEAYADILISQNFKCPICKVDLLFAGRRTNRTACVDHSHVSGKVRGVLCNCCNLTIGKFLDSATLLRCAADYLDSTNK